MNQEQATHSLHLPLAHTIRNNAVFLVLLPVFFVLHGFINNYKTISPFDCFWLVVIYTIVTLLIAGFSWLFYRDIDKASVLAFSVMTFNFLFGSIQDALKGFSPAPFVSQYRFMLPLSCLLLLAIAIALKKRKNPLKRLTTYLNFLLLLLIVIDGGMLIVKTNRSQKNTALYPSNESFVNCDSCQRPDIYFILLDEYTSGTALRQVFGFDNAAFESELTLRGFHIAKKSTANYNLTPFSLASILNMNYLDRTVNLSKATYLTDVYGAIRESRVIQFFQEHGYQFYNLSVFDFPGQRAHGYGAFLPCGTELITSQTLTGRLTKTIRTDVLNGKLTLALLQRKILYQYLHFNDDIIRDTRKVAATRTTNPKLVYSHLLIPHWPYYYDSKGNLIPMQRLIGYNEETSPHDYIEYLQYGNKKILELVDNIFNNSASPPVVILLGDHGFRKPVKGGDHSFDFMNLNAVYFPGRSNKEWPDSISNVNFFRVFLNNFYNQHLPLLKDSTIDLSLPHSPINELK